MLTLFGFALLTIALADHPSANAVEQNRSPLSPVARCVRNEMERISSVSEEMLAYLAAVKRLDQSGRVMPSSGQTIRQTRVETPVPGLYESIPRQAEVSSENIKIIANSYQVKVYMNDREVGAFYRTYDSRSKTLYFLGSKLAGAIGQSAEKAPGFVNFPGVTPLLHGRGIPTQAFSTLQFMKLNGIRYGELRHAVSNSITNVRTALQLMHSPQVRKWSAQNPGSLPSAEVLAEAVRESHSVAYMETALTQSGHRIDALRLSPGSIKWIPLKEFISKHADEIDDSVVRLLVQEYKDGKPVPFPPDQLVPYNFRIECDLVPIGVR